MQRKPAQPHIPTREMTSAGGIAFRDGADGPEAALILTAEEKRWQLPKGLVDPGETPKQAAIREVREEAGIDCEILEPVETIDYWFISNWDGERARIHKHVHFFLMRYLSGDVADHDHEVAEARWFSVKDAVETLSFEQERSLVLVAADMYSRHAAGK